MDRVRGWSTRTKIIVGVVVTVVALAILGALTGPRRPGTAVVTPTPTATATPLASEPTTRPSVIGVTPLPSATAIALTPAPVTPAPVTQAPVTAAPATPPPATPAGAFEDVALSGSGGKVELLTLPDDATAIARITHRGDSNFAVLTLTEDGETSGLLVNEIGNYSGTRLVTQFEGQPAALKIEADGRWTITIQDASKATLWDGHSPLSGAGDDVVHIDPLPSGLTIITVTHQGDSNFAILAHGDLLPFPELLVNEIGDYSAETTLPSGTDLLEITADGQWSVTPD